MFNQEGLFGIPIHQKVEDVPIGAGVNFRIRGLNNLLPIGLTGYNLTSFEIIDNNTDPVVLVNRWGHIVYQWPDDFLPTWIDVLNVCKSLSLC